MNTLHFLKNQTTKFLSIMLIAGLAVGCASVTDAGLNDAGTESVESTSTTDNVWLNGNGDDMDPIRPAPPGGDD